MELRSLARSLSEGLDDLGKYDALVRELEVMDGEQRRLVVRELTRIDLFFMMWFVCGRKDMRHEWILARCREVQAKPNGMLDLWSRDHYKSSIITFGKTVQDILASHGDDPLEEWNGMEPTFGIFACTRGIAKAFLGQIKTEFENNELMKELFPDVLWSNPRTESPSWSEEGGIIVKRKSNPKESTVEAWGVVDNQPTSKHFKVRVYDDLITADYVTSPEIIDKVTSQWELSLNLGSHDGFERYIGTRYHFNDTYRVIMERGAAQARIHAATVDGTAEGEPVFLHKEVLAQKRQRMGPYTFSSQMLLNPIADATQGFKREWLRYYGEIKDDSGMNKYLLVDPANEKKRSSDWTAMFIVGLSGDGNYYILDILRDRLNLTERAEAVVLMHKRWKPKNVGYEKYGMQADVQYLEKHMEDVGYRFGVTELGGKLSKVDRIRRMIPLFENGKVWFPRSLNKTNYEGKVVDLTRSFVEEEYCAFPVGLHDDMLDCLARIVDNDLGAIFPDSASEVTGDKYALAQRRGKKRGAELWAI